MSDEPSSVSVDTPPKGYGNSGAYNSLNQSSIATFSTAKHSQNSSGGGPYMKNQPSSARGVPASAHHQNLMSIQQADYLERAYAQKSALSEQHLIELDISEVASLLNRKGSSPNTKPLSTNTTHL